MHRRISTLCLERGTGFSFRFVTREVRALIGGASGPHSDPLSMNRTMAGSAVTFVNVGLADNPSLTPALSLGERQIPQPVFNKGMIMVPMRVRKSLKLCPNDKGSYKPPNGTSGQK